MPQISVVVPVYKVEKYIHRCVDSILNQTFSDFELILVDDGSPDNCGKICDEYAEKDKRVVVIHKENGGLSDARNAGIDWAFENSDSEWLTFIDSDDWVHVKYLDLLYNVATENNVRVSSCGHKNVGDENLENCDVPEYTIDIDNPENMVKKGYSYYEYNFSTAWGRLYKKELFENIRFLVGRLHEDEFTTYKLIYACDRIAVIKLPLYYYFQNESGIMASTLTVTKMCAQLDSFKEQMAFFYEKGFRLSFQRPFRYFCIFVENYLMRYKHNNEYALVLKSYKKDIKCFLKMYHAYLPDMCIKYGYKNWLSGRAFRIENFKNDVYNTRRDKGLLYAILWAVKNYWKI